MVIRRMLESVVFLAASTGCMSPTAYPIVGPDGSRMLHVSCGADEGRCFQLAGESCPLGYEMYAVHPPRGDTFLVRCRSAAVAQQPVSPGSQAGGWQTAHPSRYPAPAATAPATASASPPRPSTSHETAPWPPTGEADTVSPWPTAAVKAVPPGAAPATGSATGAARPGSGLPGSPDDIGY
jgi:hypothetical protein